MSITEKIARFVVDTRFEAMPREALEIAKEQNLDTLGVALAGSKSETGRVIIDYVGAAGGTPEACVLGSEICTSAEMAAFANAVMAHADDYDDTWLPLGHPSCTVFPVIFALAETLRLPGKAVLEAYLIAMEVHGKIGFGLQYESLRERGFHGTSVYGVMGSTAAAARLLGLSVEQTRTAFGIAASDVGGLRRNVTSMAKAFHAGKAARMGIMAARLARQGFTADSNILDGNNSFGRVFFGKDESQLEEALKYLGNPFSLVYPGVGIKKYPCCFLSHGIIDSVLGLIEEHAIAGDAVEAVEVGVAHEAFMNRPVPKTGHEAKFSLQYLVAAAILDGKVVRETFSRERVGDPELGEVIKRVSLVKMPWLSRVDHDVVNPVTIRLKDGRVYLRKTELPESSWKSPRNRARCLEKYRDNARQVIAGDEAERSIKLMLDLENVGDAGEVIRVVSTSK